MYAVVRLSRKWRLPVEYFYFPRTDEGLRRAQEKRSELLAKFLDNDVELQRIDVETNKLTSNEINCKSK